MNLANHITILRFILIPFFIASVLYGRLGWAIFIFVAACFTDALDGYIARRFNQKTELGAMIDPLADKFLIVSAFICLVFVNRAEYTISLPPYVPIIVVSRDIMILVGAIIVYMLRGELKVQPSKVGKVTTVFQMATIIAILLQFKYSAYLWNLTVLFTIVSGIGYLIRGGEILSEK